VAFVLKPTKQRIFKGDIFGFDIETANDNKDFVCASIWHENPKFCKSFLDKKELINYFKLKRFKGSYVAATNLAFDFFGTFFGEEEVKNFKTLFRGSGLLFAKTFIENQKFCLHRKKKKKNPSLTFIDTGNFASLSVADLGNLIGVKKLDSPSFIGEWPKNRSQWREMVKYNMRDSEVSARALRFLFDSFQELGATPKLTIASTSMSLFKNKYLKKTFYRHPESILLELFEAYYGGRTEAFKRGPIKNYNYYDVNSLYPDVMRNEFPDPNSLRFNRKNDVRYIESFEGVADVTIHCPDMEYPLLPYRTNDKISKLIFPTGTFRGKYSFVELRKALQLGYVIKEIHKNIYYTKKCRPFYDYVNDLYNKRLEYKKQKSPMQYVTKILMNSLYGKFGQKFMDKDNWEPFNHTPEDLAKLKDFRVYGDYIYYKKKISAAAFCIPIWALYVTSYARNKLHDYITRCDPAYVDTDSLLTQKNFFTTNELGGLKLEHDVKTGFVIKPKFYALITQDNKKMVKAKGIGFKLCMADFHKILECKSVTYKKFVKFKEAIRRGFIPNEIIDITKELDLNDNKRVWSRPLSFDTLEGSKPINIHILPKSIKSLSINVLGKEGFMPILT